MHAPVALAGVQGWPHPPQCNSELAVSMPSSTAPSQSLSISSHASSPPRVSVQAYSQPSPGSPSRSWNPGAQSPSSHMPSLHTPAAPGYSQACSHSPQCSGSLVRSAPAQGASSGTQMKVTSAPALVTCKQTHSGGHSSSLPHFRVHTRSCPRTRMQKPLRHSSFASHGSPTSSRATGTSRWSASRFSGPASGGGGAGGRSVSMGTGSESHPMTTTKAHNEIRFIRYPPARQRYGDGPAVATELARCPSFIATRAPPSRPLSRDRWRPLQTRAWSASRSSFARAGEMSRSRAIRL